MVAVAARLLGLTALLGLLLSCGGSSPGGPTTTPTTAAPQPNPTPSPTPGAASTIKLVADRKSGASPLAVSFDVCGSTDAGGQKNLTFTVSFEGEPPQSFGGNCGFAHTYRTSGITVFDPKVCGKDPTGAEGCTSVEIKTYVDISLSVKQNTGCVGTIEATATLGTGIRAMGAIDRMLFEARTENGQRASKEGSKNGNSWSTGTWKTGFTTKVNVTATAFSGSVSGGSADSGRPGC